MNIVDGDPDQSGRQRHPLLQCIAYAGYLRTRRAFDVRLRQGDLSGSFVARYKPARAASMNQVQTCTGNPNVEANWRDAGMFSGGKATISGITPGTVLWVRVRTVGLKGLMGAGSDPAKIMVT